MASVTNPAALPTPDHITLLLKRHKSTVVLSILPEQSIASIKELLLAALRSRDLSTLPGSTVALPDSADEFEFGVLKDKKDPSRGWVLLDNKIVEAGDTKTAKRKASGKQSTISGTASGTGLGDGSLIVYRLVSERRQQDEADANDMADILDDPGWDVILPMYEDEVGEDS